MLEGGDHFREDFVLRSGVTGVTNRAPLQAQLRRTIHDKQFSFPDVLPQCRHAAVARLAHNDELRHSRTCRGRYMARAKAVTADVTFDSGTTCCLADDPGNRVRRQWVMRNAAAFPD